VATDLSTPVFGHLRAGVQASLSKTALLIDAYGPHRTIYLTGIDAKWQGREGFPRPGGSGLLS